MIAAAIILIVIAAKRKQIRLGDVSCVTGGVKTGKSIVTLTLARRKYKSNLRKWKLKKILCKIFRKEIPEKPLFYSNIRLGWEYVPMTREIFLREKRLAYKSVAFVDEWITILGYGWNSSGSGSTNIFSSDEVSSTFVKIEKTITFDTTHLVIEIDNNIPITMVLAELSIKLNNQSYGLYNSGIETYINTMKSYTENTEESGENTGFENGINYSKYGVFSGAEVTSAKLDYNNWQPSELKIDFINNGISFESIAKQFDNYCYENSIYELGFTITLSTVPFLWTNNNFFVSMSYGFSDPNDRE